MGRVKGNIEINENSFWTLFDSGARNCYILKEVAKNFPVQNRPVSFRVALGGTKHILNKEVLLYGTIQNKPISFDAFLIEDLGQDEQGKKISILFGALAMQKWGIELNLKKEKIDMTHYSKEFLEY